MDTRPGSADECCPAWTGTKHATRTDMLNGQTAFSTGEFHMWASETGKYVDDGIFFSRYRKGKIKL